MTLLRRVPFWILLALALVWTLLPIVWMAATSLKPPGEFVSTSVSILPEAWTLEHYRALMEGGFPRRLLNTAIVAAGSVALSLVTGFMASYALARFRFPARLDVVFLLWILIVKMVPPIAIAIPLFRLLGAADLLNNLGGLILVYQVYTLPYCVWMLLGFVRDVPVEFEEAAAIDGANLMQNLGFVVVPLVGPGLMATGIFAAIMSWNEFLYALLFLQAPRLQTLPLYIANFITENETLWGQLMGIGLLSALPILLISGYIQRYLLRGFGMGLR